VNHGDVEIELVESSGGAFEISVGDRKVFSKLDLGRFPAYQEIPLLLT
jgi:selT/selW/selH-like putative selenoprotein